VLGNLSLADRDVHVWWARQADPERWLDLLDANERSRLTALRREEDRARFVTACALLRTAVAAYRDVEPRAVVVQRTCRRCARPHGKPHVAGTDGLEVSLAHSGEVVAVAVARGACVGLDVEELALRVHDLPLRYVLTERESGWYQLLPEHERTAAFVTLWTRKEAVLKATGEGLTVPMTEFSVAPPGKAPGVVEWPTRPDGPRRLRLYDLDPGPRHAATLAVLDPAPRNVVELDGDALLEARA
jgi:4'-phosphopantetheinyl transferase